MQKVKTIEGNKETKGKKGNMGNNGEQGLTRGNKEQQVVTRVIRGNKGNKN